LIGTFTRGQLIAPTRRPEIRSHVVLARPQPAVTVPTNPRQVVSDPPSLRDDRRHRADQPGKPICLLGDGNIGRIADAQHDPATTVITENPATSTITPTTASTCVMATPAISTSIPTRTPHPRTSPGAAEDVLLKPAPQRRWTLA